MFEGEFVKEKEIKKEKNNIKDLKIILHYLKDKKLKLIIYVIILILGIIPQLLYGLTWGFALQALVSKELDLFLIILSSYYFICIFFNCLFANGSHFLFTNSKTLSLGLWSCSP